MLQIIQAVLSLLAALQGNERLMNRQIVEYKSRLWYAFIVDGSLSREENHGAL